MALLLLLLVVLATTCLQYQPYQMYNKSERGNLCGLSC